VEPGGARRLILPPEIPATAARILALAGWEIVTEDEDARRAVWNAAPGAPGEIGLVPVHLGDPARVAGLRIDPGSDGRLGRSLARRLDDGPPDDTAMLDLARAAMARMRHWGLVTAPTPPAPPAPAPEPGYVLILDQPAREARRNDIQELVFLAAEEHPGAPLRVLSPPDGQVRDGDLTGSAARVEGAPPLHALLEGARAIYTVSATLGFDAILAGHRPVVTGEPVYAGHGLTDDRGPVTRRRRTLTRAQLFAAMMIEAPLWYDPHRDALCDIGTALSAEAALLRAAREDARGYVAAGFRMWKRGWAVPMLGGRVRFVRNVRRGAELTRAMDRPLVVWGEGEAPEGALRAEDGFLRSNGLGAQPVPPVSVVLDDLGSYFDPSRESRLERLIAEAVALPDAELERARQLLARIRALGLSKHNIPGGVGHLEPGTILVPGEVEDDASVRLGASEVRTNLDLLRRVREAHPDARIVYKPHPDVEARLRGGRVHAAAAREYADGVATGDPARLLGPGVRVWTMTSGLGFEALLRGCEVTTLGAPFYAGWGLTRDLGTIPARRMARPTLAGLVHAALIGYPRYRDPASGLPCPVEVAVERLAADKAPRAGGVLARLQGLRATLRLR
jgi:capsular polysaccharide export protein